MKNIVVKVTFFRIFDSDGNGSLDFKEFLMALDIAQCQDERQKLEWSFRYLDQPMKSFFLFQVVFVGLEWLHNSQISNCKSRTKILFHLLLKTCSYHVAVVIIIVQLLSLSICPSFQHLLVCALYH